MYFKNNYNTASKKTIDSISNCFLDTLINHIVHHWHNTTWAFEGYTNTPIQGEIACYYFVSTTLKYFEFNLYRYKMAQQAGLNEVLSIQARNELKIYRNIDYPKLKKSFLVFIAMGYILLV